jgi:hypothetical protein
MTGTSSFEAFLASLGRIGEGIAVADGTTDTISEGGARLEDLARVDRPSLAGLVEQNPEWIRVLGLAVGLSQEQLQVNLNQWVGTRSYRVAARRSAEVIAALDELGLVARIEAERGLTYRYRDILLARYGSRATAGRAISRGRALEDVVQAVVDELRLPRVMRTRFAGQGGRTGPCDLAMPGGGEKAQIVVGIKGFNSTGSKLTDATREIEEMAAVRMPRQYVFAVVDGLGWRGRKADLRRIHALLERHDLDGLYTQATMTQFREDVSDAAKRCGIEPLGETVSIAEANQDPEDGPTTTP